MFMEQENKKQEMMHIWYVIIKICVTLFAVISLLFQSAWMFFGIALFLLVMAFEYFLDLMAAVYGNTELEFEGELPENIETQSSNGVWLNKARTDPSSVDIHACSDCNVAPEALSYPDGMYAISCPKCQKTVEGKSLNSAVKYWEALNHTEEGVDD